MKYYSRDCKKLSLNTKTLKYLDSGECARVRYDDKLIFKEYYISTEPEYRLSPEMFAIFETIDNQHFMKIYNIYSRMNGLRLLSTKTKILPFTIDAYTAKYYKDDNVDVLEAPKDYLLDNFRELEDLFTLFTTNKINPADLKRRNTILNNNGIILIDPDSFSLSSDSKIDLSLKNKKALLNLFKDILLECAYKKEECQQNIVSISEKIKADLTDFAISENTEITNELSKKLKYVKKPIAYLTK